MQNYYNLLDIDYSADKKEIKKAYIQKIKIHTPEKDPEGFRRIRNAYETLFDDEKRRAYDKYFEVDMEYRADLMYAGELIGSSKFPQAIKLLEKLDMYYPKRIEIQRMLGMAYVKNGNYGKAINLYEQLYNDNKQDQELALLLANAYDKRKYYKKAENQFMDAIAIDNKNPDAWILYLRFTDRSYRRDFIGAYEAAVAIDPNMFAQDLYIYIMVSNEFIRYYSNDEGLKCLLIFAKLFVKEENPTDRLFEKTVEMMKELSKFYDFKDAMDILLPALEKSEYRTYHYKSDIQIIKNNIELMDFHNDGRLKDDFKEYVLMLRDKQLGEKDSDLITGLFMAEYSIVIDFSKYKKSINWLKEKYPELYNLNRTYFDDLFNNKKRMRMEKEYQKELYKVMKNNPDFMFNSILDAFEDYDDEMDFGESFLDFLDEGSTYVRTEEKVGRNSPCPCGSGKKYKQCCGKNN